MVKPRCHRFGRRQSGGAQFGFEIEHVVTTKMHETAVVGLTVHQALRTGRYGGEIAIGGHTGLARRTG
jgi:hypothetical protein